MENEIMPVEESLNKHYTVQILYSDGNSNSLCDVDQSFLNPMLVSLQQSKWFTFSLNDKKKMAINFATVQSMIWEEIDS